MYDNNEKNKHLSNEAVENIIREYDEFVTITKSEHKKRAKKKCNKQKLLKAINFITLITNEVKKSKYNSIDETINDFKLNSEINNLYFYF